MLVKGLAQMGPVIDLTQVFFLFPGVLAVTEI